MSHQDQSQKEDAWEQLMEHLEEFADTYGYAPLTVSRILVADYGDRLNKEMQDDLARQEADDTKEDRATTNNGEGL